MARQTFDLPASTYGGDSSVRGFRSIGQSIGLPFGSSNTRPYLDNIFFYVTGQIRLFIRDAPSGFSASIDLSDRFETDGRIEVTVGSQTWLFALDGSDRAQPYIWIPGNTSDFQALFAALATATDATLVLDDGRVPTVRTVGLTAWFGGFSDGFQYRVATPGNDYADWVNVGTTDGTLTGLVSRGTYQFRNGADGRVSSSLTPISGSDILLNLFLPLTNVTATPGDGEIVLAWDRVQDAITVTWRVVNGPTLERASIPKSIDGSTGYTITGLTNGTPYEVIVRNLAVATPFYFAPVTPSAPPTRVTARLATGLPAITAELLALFFKIRARLAAPPPAIRAALTIVPPVFERALLNDAGTLLTLIFSHPLNTANRPAGAGFQMLDTLNGNVIGKGSSGISVVGNEVRISFAFAIRQYATLSGTYDTSTITDANELRGTGPNAVRVPDFTFAVRRGVLHALAARLATPPPAIRASLATHALIALTSRLATPLPAIRARLGVTRALRARLATPLPAIRAVLTFAPRVTARLATGLPSLAGRLRIPTRQIRARAATGLPAIRVRINVPGLPIPLAARLATSLPALTARLIVPVRPLRSRLANLSAAIVGRLTVPTRSLRNRLATRPAVITPRLDVVTRFVTGDAQGVTARCDITFARGSTPRVRDQTILFDTIGVTEWTVPEAVREIQVELLAAGGGGSSPLTNQGRPGVATIWRVGEPGERRVNPGQGGSTYLDGGTPGQGGTGGTRDGSRGVGGTGGQSGAASIQAFDGYGDGGDGGTISIFTGGGGGGGGYWLFVETVTAGDVIRFSIGRGGTSGTGTVFGEDGEQGAVRISFETGNPLIAEGDLSRARGLTTLLANGQAITVQADLSQASTLVRQVFGDGQAITTQGDLSEGGGILTVQRGDAQAITSQADMVEAGGARLIEYQTPRNDEDPLDERDKILFDGDLSDGLGSLIFTVDALATSGQGDLGPAAGELDLRPRNAAALGITSEGDISPPDGVRDITPRAGDADALTASGDLSQAAAIFIVFGNAQALAGAGDLSEAPASLLILGNAQALGGAGDLSEISPMLILGNAQALGGAGDLSEAAWFVHVFWDAQAIRGQGDLSRAISGAKIRLGRGQAIMSTSDLTRAGGEINLIDPTAGAPQRPGESLRTRTQIPATDLTREDDDYQELSRPDLNSVLRDL